MKTEEKVLTKQELIEMESKAKTKGQRILDRVICFSPVAAAAVLLGNYYLMPNYGSNTITNVYPIFIGILTAMCIGAIIGSFFHKRIFYSYRYKAPLYTVVFLLMMGWDILTLKKGIMVLPYFPWIDKVLNAMIGDASLLLDCVRHSLILLFTGYFAGVASGLLTGIACGYSKKFYYWISPIMKLLGPIPTTTWLPVILTLAASLFKGSVFIIALGVWYPVTTAAITGINNIDKSYFEAARTLGAKEKQLIFRVAIPSAVPSIFQGLIQGMSTACNALLVAEMLGVESGLGWYITWQKGWAEFSKMYGAIVLICITFTVVNVVLSRLKKRVLKWQEGAVQA